MIKSVTRARLAWNLKRLVRNHPTINTQTALAERSGLGIPTINGLWLGKRGLRRIEDLDLICHALDVDLTELFAAPIKPDHYGRDIYAKRSTLDSPPDDQPTPQSPVVIALRAIIKNEPNTAAEAIAALLGQVDRGEIPPAEPGRIRAPRQHDPRRTKTPPLKGGKS